MDIAGVVFFFWRMIYLCVFGVHRSIENKSMEHIPLLCALAGIVFLGSRMQHLATIAGMVGLVTMVYLVQHQQEEMQARERRPRSNKCPCHACRKFQQQHFRPTTEFMDEEGTTMSMDEEGTTKSEEPPKSRELIVPPEPVASEEDAEEEEEIPAATGGSNTDGWGDAFVAEHTTVGYPRKPGRGANKPIGSPNLQLLDRQRLPIAVAGVGSRQQRLRRVGLKTGPYRSTTGQTSSFGR